LSQGASDDDVSAVTGALERHPYVVAEGIDPDPSEISMSHQPPDDRRVSGGAVIAAWAIVAGLVAATLFASVLAKPAPMEIPLTAQADNHVDR